MNKFFFTHVIDVIVKQLRGVPYYISDFCEIKRQQKSDKQKLFPINKIFPVFADRFRGAGTLSKDYFYQDLFVARKIYEANPIKHVDIGSLIRGFVAHVAVFREIEVFDIRTHNSEVSNIVFKQADLMQLPEGMKNYCDSISALHSIEHFGLGRYGDPIDYFGHIKAIENITNILKPGGIFYFSVPIGKQRIEFNGHRVFAVSYIWDLLKNNYDLLSFSYVDNQGDFYENVSFTEPAISNNFGCDYKIGVGIGIFELKKKV